MKSFQSSSGIFHSKIRFYWNIKVFSKLGCIWYFKFTKLPTHALVFKCNVTAKLHHQLVLVLATSFTSFAPSVTQAFSSWLSPDCVFQTSSSAGSRPSPLYCLRHPNKSHLWDWWFCVIFESSFNFSDTDQLWKLLLLTVFIRKRALCSVIHSSLKEVHIEPQNRTSQSCLHIP